MRGFGDSKPLSGNKEPRLEELVDRAEVGPEFRTFRIIGPVRSYYQFWFTIKTKTKGAVDIPRLCLDFDAKIDDFNGSKCPYRKSGLGRGSKFYVVNVIDRELQDNKPRKISKPTKSERKTVKLEGVHECCLKEKGSPSWTPVRVLVLPASQAERLKSLIRLNVHKDKSGKKRAFELSDPKYGMDIIVKYDANINGPNKYDIQRDKPTKLSEEERNYLLYPLDILKTKDLDAAEKDMEELSKIIIEKKDGKNKKRNEKDDNYENDISESESESSESESSESEKSSRKKMKIRR